MFEVIWTIAAFVAGAIAAVTGFGSVLTPLLSVRHGAKLAVATSRCALVTLVRA